MTTLPEIVDRINRFNLTLIESQGELTPELDQCFTEITTDLANKVDHITYALDRMEIEEDYWRVKAEATRRIAASYAKSKDRLKRLVKDTMGRLEVWELQGQDNKMTLSPMSPKLIIEDELLVPQSYKQQVTSWEVDKDKAIHDLESGKSIPGLRLERVQALKIRLNRGSI
jgi:hypothetical protein